MLVINGYPPLLFNKNKVENNLMLLSILNLFLEDKQLVYTTSEDTW